MYVLMRNNKHTTKLQDDDYALKGPQKLIRQKCQSQQPLDNQDNDSCEKCYEVFNLKKMLMASIRCVNKSKVIYL